MIKPSPLMLGDEGVGITIKPPVQRFHLLPLRQVTEIHPQARGEVHEVQVVLTDYPLHQGVMKQLRQGECAIAVGALEEGLPAESAKFEAE